MSVQIQYGKLMHKALRGLMAEVLADIAESGLPGDHHFFITFDTRHAGVDIPQHLLDRFPEKMAIVLQHEYEDLTVMPDRFAVTLFFSDVPCAMVVPFDAILTFVDPSVEFGLRFDSTDGDIAEVETLPAAAPPPDDDPDGSGGAGGDVVSLDRFRKT